MIRTVTVGSSDTAEAARRHADLVIQPRVEGVGLLDWLQLDRVVEAGRVAARRALEKPPGWLMGPSSAGEIPPEPLRRFSPDGDGSATRVRE
jgi:predicted acylesterase/phospholipase RssA